MAWRRGQLERGTISKWLCRLLFVLVSLSRSCPKFRTRSSSIKPSSSPIPPSYQNGTLFRSPCRYERPFYAIHRKFCFKYIPEMLDRQADVWMLFYSPPRKSRHPRKRTPFLSAPRSQRVNLYSALPTSLPLSMTPLSISPICLERRPSPA